MGEAERPGSHREGFGARLLCDDGVAEIGEGVGQLVFVAVTVEFLVDEAPSEPFVTYELEIHRLLAGLLTSVLGIDELVVGVIVDDKFETRGGALYRHRIDGLFLLAEFLIGRLWKQC